jgi:hypothetical protein
MEVTGMRAIAVVGWLGIVAALLVWQGIGLVHRPESPTFSDFFRSFMTVPLGRFILFGLWLWLGWHQFIRGGTSSFGAERTYSGRSSLR